MMEDDFIKSILDSQDDENSLLPLEKIKVRKAKLKVISENLKSKFVDLDDQIDEIISLIRVWYLMPELLTRPVVVCLWGMTGVGKTDLIRNLTHELGMTDSFLEIQLAPSKSSSAGGSGFGSIRKNLSHSNIEAEKPGILLLDEIQRFRTVGEHGDEIRDSAYQDIWMLLSDGKFSGSTDKEDIYRIIFSDLYYYIPGEDTEEEQISSKNKVAKSLYKTPYSDAKRLKKLLKLDESIESIMRWTPAEKVAIASKKMKEQKTYAGESFSNLLIFISGNLDEAYQMASSVDNVDTDADVLHQYSKKINMLTVKKALIKRFKPEQIARFGNNHVIYPSMSSKSYQKLIQKKLEQIIQKVSELHHIQLRFDSSVNEFIYRNGVIPSQGTRPVFSTISGYIENIIPSFILETIEGGWDNIYVLHKEDKLIGKLRNTNLSDTKSDRRLKEKVIKTPCEGVVDKIKNAGFDKNQRAITSVHEAGHAIVYAILTGYAPTHIVVNTASSDSDGFVGLHNHLNTKTSMADNIAYTLGGRSAEEIVFGRQKISSGAASDLETATRIATSYQRRLGMGNFSIVFAPITSENAVFSDTGIEDLRDATRRMIRNGLERSKRIISNNKDFFRETAKALYDKGKISEEDFCLIAKNNEVELRTFDPEKVIYPNLVKDFNLFMEE